MEDKIEINEYVRTPLGIAKYLGECDDMPNFYKFDNLDEELWFGDIADIIYKTQLDEVVLKYSQNIIDLIEVGDIVMIERGKLGHSTHIIETELGLNMLKEDLNKFKDEHIKSIVTKEQFKRVEYKL